MLLSQVGSWRDRAAYFAQQRPASLRKTVAKMTPPNMKSGIHSNFSPSCRRHASCGVRSVLVREHGGSMPIIYAGWVKRERV